MNGYSFLIFSLFLFDLIWRRFNIYLTMVQGWTCGIIDRSVGAGGAYVLAASTESSFLYSKSVD